MEKDNGRASRVSEVAIPIEVVELAHLRTKDGKPVRVNCERLPEDLLLEAVGLPGAPDDGKKNDEPEPDPKKDPAAARARLEQKVNDARRLAALLGPLIEAGTWLEGDDGEEVRPAFYFDASKPRHAASIPGRYLRAADIERLGIAILRVGGYIGGAADEGTFHGNKKGRADRLGAPPARARAGKNGVGDAPRPAPRVQPARDAGARHRDARGARGGAV